MKQVLLSVVCFLTFVCGSAFAEDTPTTPNQTVIEAQKIVLRDSEGRVRIEICVDKDVPQIKLRDSYGEVEVIISGSSCHQAHSYDWEYPAYVNVIKNFDEYTSYDMTYSINPYDALIRELFETVAKLNTDVFSLTDKVSKVGITLDKMRLELFLGLPDDMMKNIPRFTISVHTMPNPKWAYHQGEGRLSVSNHELSVAYIEAAGIIMAEMPEFIRDGMYGYKPSDLKIDFFVSGYPIGSYCDEVMSLTVE